MENLINDNECVQDSEHEIRRFGMKGEDYREAGEDLLQYIVQYYRTVGDRQPFPDVQPGFLMDILPPSAPSQPGKWKELLKDIENVVMKGMTHWQSAKFFAFYPCVMSYPSLLGGLLCDGLANCGFSWASGPSCTELETMVLDWLAKALALPEFFRHDGKGPGCGVIQSTASEATLMTLLAQRTKVIRKKMAENPGMTQHDVLSKLVAYTSEYSHSSVERAGAVAMVSFRKLPVDGKISVRGETLRQAIDKDKADGRIPFYFCATLGTTGCCSFDNMKEIGEICNAEHMWLHVDAAYAGNIFICPEYRYLMDGIEFSDSFNCNVHKWLMVNFDCSALWVKNSEDLIHSLRVDPIYFQHENMDASIDYRHMQIPLSRRFRSLKLWFSFRLIGVEGMKRRLRDDIEMAKFFKSFVTSDLRFEVVFPNELSLVCIRLVKDKDDPVKNRELNKRLVKKINDSREIYLIGAQVEGVYFLRLIMGTANLNKTAVSFCWAVVQRHATILLQEVDVEN